MENKKVNLLADRDQARINKNLKNNHKKWQDFLDKAALNIQLHGLPTGKRNLYDFGYFLHK